MSSFQHGHRHKTHSTRHDQKPSSAPKFKELMGYVAGVSGLFVFYFWVAGRMYAVGYFGAMNIPPYMVSFPIWEYIEQSWFRLLIIFLTYLIIGGILLIVLESLWHWILMFGHYLIRKFGGKLKTPPPIFSIFLPDLGRYIKLVDLSFKLLITLSWFSILLFYILITGVYNGTTRVFAAQSIEVASSNIDISDQYFHDLRLLTYNQGKYFVFNEVDPATCKPKVIVIDESNLSVVKLDKLIVIDLPGCKSEAINWGIFQFPIKIPQELITDFAN